METNSILSANILDIIFEGRNKVYGAYDLRKTYSSRIGSALGVTAIAIMIFAVAVSWKGANENKSSDLVIKDLKTTEVQEDKKELPPPPVKPPKPEPPVKRFAFTPPIIVKPEEVLEPPVENDKLADAIIDTKTTPGADYQGFVAPPDEIKNSSVNVEGPKTKIENELPFTKVEKEAQFNGNWSAYLQKEIEKNMDELTEAGESGTCLIKFVVSKDGRVSNVEATTMKGTKLAEVAANAIRKGPKWIPAMQNGNIVNAYRIQPVTFKIND